MKKIIAILICCLFLWTSLYCQRLPNLIPFRKQDKWGYADSTRKVIIQPQYLSAGLFSDGVANVQMNDSTWGFIDEKNSLLFSEKYENIYEFHSGLIRTEGDSGSYGFMNRKAQIIIPIKYDGYDHEIDFQFGYAFGFKLTDLGSKGIFVSCEVLDTMGNIIVKFDRSIDYINKLSNKLAIVHYGDTSPNAGLLDIKKKQVVIYWQDNILTDIDSIKKEVTKLGYRNREIRLVFPKSRELTIRGEYILTRTFPKDQIWFPKLIVNKTKKIYEDVWDYDDTLYPGHLGNDNWNWGCLDKHGNEIVPFVFSKISYAGSGLYYTCAGYIDRYGKYYWES